MTTISSLNLRVLSRATATDSQVAATDILNKVGASELVSTLAGGHKSLLMLTVLSLSLVSSKGSTPGSNQEARAGYRVKIVLDPLGDSELNIMSFWDKYSTRPFKHRLCLCLDDTVNTAGSAS